MADATAGELEVSLPGGASARAKGYRLMDIVCLASAFGVGYLCMMVYMHDAAAAKESSAIVQVVKEQTKVQWEMINAQREANCLNRLTPEEKKRRENIDFCSQLGRGR